MVAEVANTTVTVFRGTTKNEFGDLIDSNVPYLQGLTASLIETGRQVQDPASPTPRTIRAVQCILPDWVQVLNTDRIYDERTGDTFIIISVTRPPDLFGPPPGVVLLLKRVTAAGP